MITKIMYGSELMAETMNHFRDFGKTSISVHHSTTPKNMETYIHASNGIRSDDTSFRAVQDHIRFRLHDH